MTCTGNVELWDQTLGCPTCNRELWNYPGMLEGETNDQYEARFYGDHPFMFDDAHDPGDEQPYEFEVPIGGFDAAYNRYHYGNNHQRWDA